MKDFEVDFDFTEERGDTDYENRIVTPSYEAGDEAEVSLRPRRMEEYIGQDKAKENLKVYIEAARMRGDSLDHVLLYGPPGLGKTTLSGIIAEVGVNLCPVGKCGMFQRGGAKFVADHFSGVCAAQFF